MHTMRLKPVFTGIMVTLLLSQIGCGAKSNPNPGSTSDSITAQSGAPSPASSTTPTTTKPTPPVATAAKKISVAGDEPSTDKPGGIVDLVKESINDNAPNPDSVKITGYSHLALNPTYGWVQRVQYSETNLSNKTELHDEVFIIQNGEIVKDKPCTGSGCEALVSKDLIGQDIGM